MNKNKENIINVFKNKGNTMSEMTSVLKESNANKDISTFGLSNPKNENIKVQEEQKIKKKGLEASKQYSQQDHTIKKKMESIPVYKSQVHKEEKSESFQVYQEIEQVRKTIKGEEEKEEKPLFIEEEESHVNIHHKEQQEKEPKVVDNKDKLLIQQLKTKVATLKKERDMKIKILSELRQELLNKRTQLTTSKEEITQNLNELKMRYKEQEDNYNELCTMLTELSELALPFKEKYDKKEQEINALLNILSETKYKIQEIK